MPRWATRPTSCAAIRRAMSTRCEARDPGEGGLRSWTPTRSCRRDPLTAALARGGRRLRRRRCGDGGRGGERLCRRAARRATMPSAKPPMGFCLFGNVAIAAKRCAGASRRCPASPIVDFDVHHGNGTQALLWDEPARAVRLQPSDAAVSRHRAPHETRRAWTDPEPAAARPAATAPTCGASTRPGLPRACATVRPN